MIAAMSYLEFSKTLSHLISVMSLLLFVYEKCCAVIEAAEETDKDEENVYSKLKDPPQDVYHQVSPVKQPQKDRTSMCFELL